MAVYIVLIAINRTFDASSLGVTVIQEVEENKLRKERSIGRTVNENSLFSMFYLYKSEYYFHSFD